MKVQYFKGYGRLARVEVTHASHRATKRHTKGLDRSMRHDTLRVVIKNEANAEAIAQMLANAEGVHDAN